MTTMGGQPRDGPYGRSARLSTDFVGENSLKPKSADEAADVADKLFEIITRALEAVTLDSSASTNTESKSASGRAAETKAAQYVIWVETVADIGVSYIPVVGTVVGVYEAYGTLSDPNSSTSDRVFAVISVLPTGKIIRVLAHSKVVQGGVRIAERGAERAAGGFREVAHPSQRAARRAAEREAGMGRHGGREILPDEDLRSGSKSPTGAPGIRRSVRSTDTGRTVHHDPYGHRHGNVPPHYGVDGPDIDGTTHHTYPSTHDPSRNR